MKIENKSLKNVIFLAFFSQKGHKSRIFWCSKSRLKSKIHIPTYTSNPDMHSKLVQPSRFACCYYKFGQTVVFQWVVNCFLKFPDVKIAVFWIIIEEKRIFKLIFVPKCRNFVLIAEIRSNSCSKS